VLVVRLGTSDLEVSRLCLGGNAFGWTADEATSFDVLDRFVAAGGTFVDTADMYGTSASGAVGGESERIIGRWLRSRGNRDEVVIATKVGALPGLDNLRAETIRTAVDDSLRRLGTDHVDLYYAHVDDRGTPLLETLTAFDELVRSGKVRHVAASNYSADRLRAAVDLSRREGLTAYVALQAEYNLVQRRGYEEHLASAVAETGLTCLPYVALARGFLTGKYRPGGPAVVSARADRASVHLDGNGPAVLAAVEEVARARRTTMPAVALAWLAAQPTVAAPLAGARTPGQLLDLLPFLSLELGADEVALLDEASAWTPPHD
jgi:aryl-alcohol dehydrogenase-like predicted oxidoreductase